MMGNSLRLGRLFGIELKLDYSWFIVFVLLVWSLSDEYFPRIHSGWPDSAYWMMGVMTIEKHIEGHPIDSYSPSG